MTTLAIALGVLVGCGLGLSAHADDHCPPTAGFSLHTLTHPGPDGEPTEYRYAVYRPEGLDIAEPAAGLLFLHGRGECGTDGTRHLAVGLGKELIWSNERWPMVVVFPQKPTQDSEWEDHAPAVLEMLDRATAEHNIDAGRVAITGLSQGGHGTLMLASMHADRFVAAAPVCGYVEPRFRAGEFAANEPPEAGSPSVVILADAIAAAGTPVWLFHGDRDTVIPAQESIAMHEALVSRGVDAKLTIHEGLGHNAWDHAYPDPALAAWLRTHLDLE